MWQLITFQLIDATIRILLLACDVRIPPGCIQSYLWFAVFTATDMPSSLTPAKTKTPITSPNRNPLGRAKT